MVLTSPDEARRQRVLLKRQQAKQESNKCENKVEIKECHETRNENIEEQTLPESVNSDESDSVQIKKPRLDIPDPKSIVSNVYRYLDQEYKFMKILNSDDRNLHLLSAIRQRTAAATGVTVMEVRKIIKENRMRVAENKHRAGAQEERNHEDGGQFLTAKPRITEN